MVNRVDAMAYVLKRQVQYKADSSAPSVTLPALFTENGLLLSHLKFLYTKRNKSQSWLERNTFSLQLLLKFINTKCVWYQTATEMLRSFVDALCFGTIEDGYDESGLFWCPRKSEDISVLLGHINTYCDYLDDIHGRELPNINPMRAATRAEERLRWCAYYKRQANCFLSHLSKPSPRQLAMIRNVQGPVRQLLDVESVYRFPEEHIDNLLNFGCVLKSSEKKDYASQLIIMLMHYGGLRLSECFHIYKYDIAIDPKTGAAMVSVFHPVDGKSPEDGYSNRRDFLKTKHRLEPRNEYPRNHKLHSGWKQPLLTHQNLSFDVMFFPAHKAIGFTKILQKYLCVRADGNHPYLFTNTRGHPESKKSFIQKYQRAITRIGHVSSKHLGTSPHAHRHSYGYRLSQYGFNQLEIQKAMHHKSPDSCLVYTRPTDDEIRELMRERNL